MPTWTRDWVERVVHCDATFEVLHDLLLLEIGHTPNLRLVPLLF